MIIAKIIIHYFYRIQFMSLKEEWQQLGPNQRIYHYEKLDLELEMFVILYTTQFKSAMQ